MNFGSISISNLYSKDVFLQIEERGMKFRDRVGRKD